jgi:hypothetical protein
MFRKQIPRLYELHDLLPVPSPPDAYFRNLDQSLIDVPGKLACYQEFEQDLQSLDPAAWTFLKSQLRPLLTARDDKRGWQALIDKLNQAKAYAYLKHCGYTQIEFIPPSTVRGQRTPDLSGFAASTKVLCEAKTINISEYEAHRRYTHGVGSTETHLPDGLLRKLHHDLIEANDQMNAYDPSVGIKRIAFLVVNFDDSIHEVAGLYEAQIKQYLDQNNPVPELEIVFDIKHIF